jgi:hypothetical protein
MTFNDLKRFTNSTLDTSNYWMVLFMFCAMPSIAQTSKLPKEISLRKGDILFLTDTTIKVPQDTVITMPAETDYKIKRDKAAQSESFYNGLKNKSKDNMWLKQVYGAVIREQRDTIIKNQIIESRKNYLPEMEGKIVGDIAVVVVDMIDGDVNDITKTATAGYSKLLNDTHKDTRRSTIIKNLSFEQGDALTAYSISDNEYYLRSLKYIEDAKIYILPDSLNANVVNLVVAVKDLFPIVVGIGATGLDKFKFNVKSINLQGTGHELSNSLIVETNKKPMFGYQGDMIFRNMWGSFFDGTFTYRSDSREKLAKVLISKEFISPETKYGGGLEFYNQRSTLNIKGLDDSTYKFPYLKDNTDLWGGRAFLLNDVQRQNLVFKARAARTRYLERPSTITSDTLQQFENTNLFLASVTLMKRDHYRERMLLSYGVPEDIDIGYAFELTAGYQMSEFIKAPYAGFSIKVANKFKMGYLNGFLEYGTHFYNNTTALGIFRVGSTYYTPLMDAGPFLLRFITRWNYTQGLNRYSYEKLPYKQEIRGLSGVDIYSDQRFLMRYELASFIDGELFGFKFSPNLYCDMAWFNDNQSILEDNYLVSTVGVGVRIRNEHMAFSTIILRLGYFPQNQLKDANWAFGLSSSAVDVIKDYKITKPDVFKY